MRFASRFSIQSQTKRIKLKRITQQLRKNLHTNKIKEEKILSKNYKIKKEHMHRRTDGRMDALKTKSKERTAKKYQTAKRHKCRIL